MGAGPAVPNHAGMAELCRYCQAVPSGVSYAERCRLCQAVPCGSARSAPAIAGATSDRAVLWGWGAGRGLPPCRARWCCFCISPPAADGGPSCERVGGWVGAGSLGSLGARVAVRAAPARSGGPAPQLISVPWTCPCRAVSLCWGHRPQPGGPRAELHNRFYTFLPPPCEHTGRRAPPAPRAPQHCERGCPGLSASAVLIFNKTFCNSTRLCPPVPSHQPPALNPPPTGRSDAAGGSFRCFYLRWGLHSRWEWGTGVGGPDPQNMGGHSLPPAQGLSQAELTPQPRSWRPPAAPAPQGPGSRARG